LGTVSFVKGVDAECTIEKNRQVIIFKSDTPLQPMAVFAGTTNFQFPMTYRTNQVHPIFLQEDELTVNPAVLDKDGRALFRVELESPSSCAGIMNLVPAIRLHGSWGVRVPAVRLKMSHDHDIYLLRFWARSDSTIDYAIPGPQLVSTHGPGQVTASIRVGPDGELIADVLFNGTGYERASLRMRRALGECFLEEAVGDVKAGGTASFVWRPILRSLDEMLICDSDTSVEQLLFFNKGLARGLPDPPGSHKWVSGGNFVLSDGEGLEYTLIMTGHRRFLSNDVETKISMRVRGWDATAPVPQNVNDKDAGIAAAWTGSDATDAG
jgi:hypothetical protein